MIKDIFQEYGWILLVIVLIVINVLCFMRTGKKTSGFHRGVNYSRKQTYGDVVIGITFVCILGYIVFLIISFIFKR